MVGVDGGEGPGGVGKNRDAICTHAPAVIVLAWSATACVVAAAKPLELSLDRS
jgi:hypothetical protein